jgi:hypothetical protein
MLKVVVGHSDDVDAEDAADSILEQCRTQLGGVTPRAALAFSGYDVEMEPVLRAVREEYPEIELIGSSSAGEMSPGSGYQEDSVLLVMFASDEVDITAGLAEHVYDDIEGSIRAAVDEARSKTDKSPRLCMTTPATFGDTRSFLETLRSALGEEVPILGGGAAAPSNRGPLNASWQFYGDRVLEGAAPILLFSGPLAFSFGIDTGWRSVGPRGRVTKSSGPGVVDEIDGKPALAFYQRYLGDGFQPAFANPLAVYESDSESPYLRAPTAHDPDTGAVSVAGFLPEGAEVQLTVAATEEIFDGARSALKQAVDRYPSPRDPEAAVIFSCAIRKYLLGTRTGDEFQILSEDLGGAVPVCGFYSFGEIAPFDAGGEIRFHNETLVAILMGTG